NFVAGELAFVTATTNNQSVSVDFASWAKNTGNNASVLGNVQSSPLPTYAESVYVAVDNGDGTVGVQIADAAATVSSMPTGLTDRPTDLEAKYNSWKSGGGPKPIPRRCGGALDLNRSPFSEPVDSGKCDSGLYWGTQNCMTGSAPWSTVSGTTAPMNGYMQ